MYIKPNKSIAPIDRKIGKSISRKTEENPDDSNFIDILDEIDVIDISTLEEEKNFSDEQSKKDKKAKTDQSDDTIKVDKFV